MPLVNTVAEMSIKKKLYEIKKKLGLIKQGDVILSDSGSATNFKYALHIAVMNYSDETQPVYPTYSQIQTALDNMLNIIKESVENENIENPSVVIPLLGCGVGGLKKEKVFLMIKSVLKKSQVDLDMIVYFHNKKDYYKFSFKEM